MDWTFLVAVVSLILGAGIITGSALVGIYVARKRGLQSVEDRADGEIKRLVDAQGERLLLLEKANTEKSLTIAAQNETIARLTARQAELQTKVADLEHQLAVERRVTASMRAEQGDGK